MPIKRHHAEQIVSERHPITLLPSSGAALEQRFGFLIVDGF